MHPGKIVISGTGCALADYLYNGISFTSDHFQKYLSKETGDGGLSPGKLVFTEELEKFSGKPFTEIHQEIMNNRTPDSVNVGGPSLVSLIHASQLLGTDDFEVQFYGVAGRDDSSSKIFEIVKQTSLNIHHYQAISDKPTPFTHVLSDPDYDHGHGERTFINNIGAAWDYTPEQLPDSFFAAPIVCFGGTGLVPNIHDNLTALLSRAKSCECLTVVNTVFDFRNEKMNPGKPWPLVNNPSDFQLINVLIMDHDEALRISGQPHLDAAAAFFAASGVSSFIITNGAKELVAWSKGDLFEKESIIRLPISRMVSEKIKQNPAQKGDTTGCGDNFAGGIIASLAWQLKSKEKGSFSLTEALSWGVSSGGFCCFTMGGTYLEKYPGEKREQVQHIQQAYLQQINY